MAHLRAGRKGEKNGRAVGGRKPKRSSAQVDRPRSVPFPDNLADPLVCSVVYGRLSKYCPTGSNSYTSGFADAEVRSYLRGCP